MSFYINLISGLNNKLIPLISLLRIANKENKRIFVYWNNNLKINSINDSLEELLDIKNVTIIKREEYYNELLNKDNIIYNNNSFYKNTSKTCVFLNTVHPIMYIEEKEYNILKPYPKKPIFTTELIQDYRNIIKEVKIHKQISERVKKTICNFEDKHVIGVHLRTSDGSFRLHNHNMIYSFIKEKVKLDNVYIYLSCDTIIFEKKIKSLFDNKILLFNSPFGNCYEDKFNRTTYGSINGFCEMYILSKCNEFYGTPTSSFTFMTWLFRNDNILKFYF